MRSEEGVDYIGKKFIALYGEKPAEERAVTPPFALSKLEIQIKKTDCTKVKECYLPLERYKRCYNPLHPDMSVLDVQCAMKEQIDARV
jgi:hypothetical protein